MGLPKRRELFVQSGAAAALEGRGGDPRRRATNTTFRGSRGTLCSWFARPAGPTPLRSSHDPAPSDGSHRRPMAFLELLPASAMTGLVPARPRNSSGGLAGSSENPIEGVLFLLKDVENFQLIGGREIPQRDVVLGSALATVQKLKLRLGRCDELTHVRAVGDGPPDVADLPVLIGPISIWQKQDPFCAVELGGQVMQPAIGIPPHRVKFCFDHHTRPLPYRPPVADGAAVFLRMTVDDGETVPRLRSGCGFELEEDGLSISNDLAAKLENLVGDPLRGRGWIHRTEIISPVPRRRRAAGNLEHAEDLRRAFHDGRRQSVLLEGLA